MPQDPNVFELDPDAVHNLLQMESQGELPEMFKPHVERARGMGLIPPPLIAGPNPAAMQKGGGVKPGVPPPPKMGIIDSAIASLPTAEQVKGKVNKATGKFLDFGASMLDPEALAATGAGMLSKSTPMGMAASGAASSAVALGRESYDAIHEGRKPNLAPVGEALVSGSLGELGGRTLGLVGGASRPAVTPEGAALKGYLERRGAPVMAHQMTDSTGLNFMGNVAKYGPGGKKIIQDVESRQSQAVLDHIQEVSEWMNNGRGISIDAATGAFDAGTAGKRLQGNIATQLSEATKKSGYSEFLGKHGDSRFEEVVEDAAGNPMVNRGPRMRESHQMRSEALAAGRSSRATRADRHAAISEANKHLEQVNKALPDDAARQEYSDISNRYHAEMSRIDNPTIQDVRTGKSNDVVDDILNSKLTNYEDLSTKVGHTNDELLKKVQQAASPEAWEQLQADTIYRVAERAIDPKTGMLDFDLMSKLMNNIDDKSKARLFGAGLKDMNVALSMLQQAQKYQMDEAGRLFIAIRTGGAAISAITGAAGLMTGNPGLGLLTSAAILSLPAVTSKILLSPKARPLLLRALGSDPKVKNTAIKALSRWVSQNVTETGRELVNEGDESGIPPPPQ